jgi:hypothetical protein
VALPSPKRLARLLVPAAARLPAVDAATVLRMEQDGEAAMVTASARPVSPSWCATAAPIARTG